MKNYWSDIRAFFLLLAILLMVLIMDIAAVAWYENRVNVFLAEQPVIQHADAGVVFFGDYIKDGQALGPDSKHRADVAAKLYKGKIIREIICVGGYDTRKWRGKPHLMSVYLEHLGIPHSKILYDSLSFNTITNWQEASKIIQREKYDTVIAISAPLHIYRIACMLKDEHIYFASYTHEKEGLHDYWQLYVDVHHEWVSRFLSFALRDDVRNRLVYIVRSVLGEIKRYF